MARGSQVVFGAGTAPVPREGLAAPQASLPGARSYFLFKNCRLGAVQ